GHARTGGIDIGERMVTAASVLRQRLHRLLGRGVQRGNTGNGHGSRSPAPAAPKRMHLNDYEFLSLTNHYRSLAFDFAALLEISPPLSSLYSDACRVPPLPYVASVHVI